MFEGITGRERGRVEADQLQLVRVADARAVFHAQHRSRLAIENDPGVVEVGVVDAPARAGVGGQREEIIRPARRGRTRPSRRRALPRSGRIPEAITDRTAIVPHLASDIGAPAACGHRARAITIGDRTKLDKTIQATNVKTRGIAVDGCDAIRVADRAGTDAHQSAHIVRAGNRPLDDNLVDRGITYPDQASHIGMPNDIDALQLDILQGAAAGRISKQTRPRYAVRQVDGQAANDMALPVEGALKGIRVAAIRPVVFPNRYEARAAVGRARPPHVGRIGSPACVDLVVQDVTGRERGRIEADQLQLVRVIDRRAVFHAQHRARLSGENEPRIGPHRGADGPTIGRIRGGGHQRRRDVTRHAGRRAGARAN